MKYPDFFIIGAAKAGTTSLYHYLDQHPDVFLSPIKEPNFYSKDIKPEKFSRTYRNNTFNDLDSYFQQDPLPKLQLAFVHDERQYLQLFANANPGQLTGDCSTSYLYSQVAAKEIKNDRPDSKIIVILRNPVERTFSHYLMAVKYGFTTRSLLEAIQNDQKNPQKGWGQSELFIELSLYYEQLKRYIDVFNRNQILILFHEDLLANPQETLNRIYKFLDLECLEIEDLSLRNVAGMPRMKNLNKILAESGIKKRIKEILPEGIAKNVRSLYLKEENLPKIKPEEREFLVGIFKEDIQKLSNLLQRDLSNWMKQKC